MGSKMTYPILTAALPEYRGAGGNGALIAPIVSAFPSRCSVFLQAAAAFSLLRGRYP